MGYGKPDMFELVGRKIESIHIANAEDDEDEEDEEDDEDDEDEEDDEDDEDDEQGWDYTADSRLVFVTDKGLLAYATEGDCCSDTWFADILGVDALIGGTVASVEDIEMPEPTDKRKRSQEDQNYGIKITTDKGISDIVYRNASNGYYGGSCRPTDNISLENTRPITADWSSN